MSCLPEKVKFKHTRDELIAFAGMVEMLVDQRGKTGVARYNPTIGMENKLGWILLSQLYKKLAIKLVYCPAKVSYSISSEQAIVFWIAYAGIELENTWSEMVRRSIRDHIYQTLS
ncbi:hypothetical protein BH09BAC1_BH09BAC1_14320 [soil metagenome]